MHDALAALEARRDRLGAYVTELILDEAPFELLVDAHDRLEQLERAVAARRAWLRAEAGRLITEFCGLCAVGAPEHAAVWRRTLGYALWDLSAQPEAPEAPEWNPAVDGESDLNRWGAWDEPFGLPGGEAA